MSILSDIFLEKLITGTMTVDQDFKFQIEFTEHEDGLPREEYVRLVLHYYAKMLANLDRDSEAALFLIKAVSASLKGPLSRESDVLHHFDRKFVSAFLGHAPLRGMKKYKISLYREDGQSRHIANKMSFTSSESQLVFSVLALFQATLKKLDKNEIETLKKSLTKMQETYKSGKDFTNWKRIRDLPNEAFAWATRSGDEMDSGVNGRT